jgi:anti-sigma factor RsiW
MNDCVGLRKELAEAALGQPASEALSRHLEECAACATELQRQRELVQRIDAAVAILVRGEPSAKLLEAIRARTRGVPRAGSTELDAGRAGARDSGAEPRAWSRRWAGITAGAAIAASVAMIIGLQVLRLHVSPVSSAVALTAWRSPTAALLELHGSVLHAPLRDVWFDPHGSAAHSKPLPGGTHGT